MVAWMKRMGMNVSDEDSEPIVIDSFFAPMLEAYNRAGTQAVFRTRQWVFLAAPQLQDGC